MTAPDGSTITEIVALALPSVTGQFKHLIRVTIGGHVIAREVWDRVKPKPHTQVIVRFVPQGDNLRTVLTLAVTVAATAFGQLYVGPLLSGALGVTSTIGTGLINAGAAAALGVGASLAIGALFPVRPKEQEQKTSLYDIQGLQNSANPNGVIPAILGTVRYAPPYFMRPYTEVIGDDLYVTAGFILGHGPLNISDVRLGDTPLSNYSDVLYEVRAGNPDDTPLTFIRRQVIEESVGAKLSAGVAVRRFTAKDITRFSVDLMFPQGVAKYNKDGEMEPLQVEFQLSYRLNGVGAWTSVPLNVGGQTANPFRRSFAYNLGARGQYEIEIVRFSPNHDEVPESKAQSLSNWTVLRSFRPEYPLNLSTPVALAAVRIKASDQLNGMIDNFNVVASLATKKWDGVTWQTGQITSNPADLYRHVLQSAGNAFPVDDAGIKLADIEAWADYCTEKGLTYNNVQDSDASLLDVLSDIAAAGRAAPHDLSGEWSVCVDRPKEIVTQTLTPRNSWGFSGERTFPDFPDAYRVKFKDASNGYREAERIINWPGLVGEPQVTQDLPMSGKTNAAEVWREARRRQYEAIYRRESFTASMDFEGLVLTRGERTDATHYILNQSHVAGRIKAIDGQALFLDEAVVMKTGKTYACRIRKADMSTVSLPVVLAVGETTAFRVDGDLTGVAAGDIVAFGEATAVAEELIVKGIEIGDNLTARLSLVPHAPQLDELVEADEVPPWDGRFGEILPDISVSPAVPFIDSISTTDSGGSVLVLITPTIDSTDWGVPDTYTVAHRISGGGAFTEITFTAGAGYATITGYVVGDTLDIKVKATFQGLDSAYSAITNYSIHIGPTADSTVFTADNGFETVDSF